jgi:tetratricopeptide (TPR) repeat protein
MTAPRTPAQIDNDAIAMAVAAYFAQADGARFSASAEDDEEEKLGSPSDIIALLADADQLGTTALWKQIIAEGLEEEVLAAFKAAAEASPNDPAVQYALAKAYLGMTQEAGNGPLAGKYATLADQALDQALEADPQHWESRFTKATALSFWPPVFGKQSAAIQEFETLVGQQTGMAQEPHFAQTHLLLGNMYQQTGQMEKAIAAWQLGLESFPGNAELTTQIALAQAASGH